MLNILKLTRSSLTKLFRAVAAQRAHARVPENALALGLSVYHETSLPSSAGARLMNPSNPSRQRWPVAPATPRMVLRGVL